jgi:AGCS family alanine or glycine:cation symporter
MALLFLGSGSVVLWVRRAALPHALYLIVTSAFTPAAAAGGVGGYTISAALRYGVARGVFTNEAGMGASALAHANADTDMPGEQGMWGILEVFTATLVICTMTALVILTTGIYDPAQALGAIRSGDFSGVEIGVPLTAASFAVVLGRTGEWVVSVCLLMFAFSSLLGWSYYGEAALGWLVKGKYRNVVWRIAFLAATVVGSVGDVSFVWQLVDLFTALMALPNLAALLILSPQVLDSLNRYLSTEKRSRP